jgi:hypothetical protein
MFVTIIKTKSKQIVKLGTRIAKRNYKISCYDYSFDESFLKFLSIFSINRAWVNRSFTTSNPNNILKNTDIAVISRINSKIEGVFLYSFKSQLIGVGYLKTLTKKLVKNKLKFKIKIAKMLGSNLRVF